MQKLATAVAVSLALASSGAMALGLGDIEMRSALNQPLDAEIVLISVEPEELEGLIVQLASREAFERAGIDKSQVLLSLDFSVNQKTDGTHIIKLGSRGPVTEPFLNFLLEVDWPKGRMIREYTILLDPPIFMNQDAVSSGSTLDSPEMATVNSAAADLAVPVPIQRESQQPEIAQEVVIDSIVISSDSNASGDTITLDDVRTPVFSPSSAQSLPINDNDVPEVVIRGNTEEVITKSESAVTETVSAPPTPTPSVSSFPTPDYTVEKNDTLWEIASQNKSGDVSVQQMMMALLSINQRAFVNDNVNRLRAGAILRMPSSDEISAITRGQAIAQMTEQNRLWQEYRDSIGRTTSASSRPQTQPETPGVVDTVTPAVEPVETAATESVETPSIEPDRETNVASNTQSTPVVSDENSSASTPKEPEGIQQPESELSIVADPNTTDSVASANSNEVEQPDTALLGQFNTEIALAQEDMESEQLRKEELQGQAEELEANKNKMERLIELRETEMAQLQQRMAEAGAEVPEEITTAMVESSIEVVPDSEPQVEETSPDMQSQIDEPEIEAPLVIDPQPEEPGFLQNLLKDPMKMAAIGLGSLGLIGVVAWLLGRRRKEDDDEEEIYVNEELFDDDLDEEIDGAIEETSEESEILAEEVNETSDIGEIQDFDDTDSDGLEHEFDHTDLLASSVDDESAKDDTISEAEVYLAYGLHGQAEDLLIKAVEREPDNQDYQLKLLETHHGQKDVDQFGKLAEQFHTQFGSGDNTPWAQIASMGREMDSDNSLYEQSGAPVTDGMDRGAAAVTALAGLAASTTDSMGALLDDKESDDTLALGDFDGTSDLTEVLEKSADNEESLLDQSIDPGFVFDESELEATGDFSKIVENQAAVIGSMPPDVSEVLEDAESLQSANDSELEQSLNEELDLSEELVFDDVSESDEQSHELALDKEESLDSMFSELELESDESEKEGIRVIPLTETGSDLDTFSDATLADFEETSIDFEESVLDLSSISGDDSDDSPKFLDTAAGAVDELTLDLDDLISDQTKDEKIDVAFDHTETLETAFDQTQELEIPDLTSNADLTTSDDSSAFGSTNEMETMLDLAKAYIDMGDNESASSALGEIMKEGSDEQKSTAEQLLKKIG